MSSPSAFGNYRVLHQIGSGVLGPVFRSYDSQRDRLVAIKAVKLDLVPEDAARLAEAFRALASAAVHPAIVGVVDAGLEGSTPFLALEYASGDSLDVVLRQSGAIANGRALPILVELARAIDASWERGVGHGALHPRDVFLTGAASEVRVTGFGIAQALEKVGAKSPLRRPYAAPERVAGLAWDRRADLYALAVIAQEMVIGRRPASAADLDGSVCGDVPAEAHHAWRGVLAHALAERAEDRFETAAAMIDALTAAVQGQAHETPKRPARARRARVSAVDAPRLPGVDVDSDADVAADPDADAAISPLVIATAAVAAATAAPRPQQPAPARTIDPILRTNTGSPGPFEAFDGHEPQDHATARFPWAATLAVTLASLVLGGVIGYQVGFKLGFKRGNATAIAREVNSAPAPDPPPVVSEPEPTAEATPTPAAPTGRLVIQSEPAGALAFIDGRRVGETPITVPGIPFGRHDVRTARPGYVPATEAVTLSATAPARTVRLRLRRGAGAAPVPTAATGAIDVETRPRGARVTVDGKSLGQTPLRVPELSPGDHRVLLELAGHKPVTSTVKVVAGEQTRLAVTLEQVEWDRVVVPRKFR